MRRRSFLKQAAFLAAAPALISRASAGTPATGKIIRTIGPSGQHPDINHWVSWVVDNAVSGGDLTAPVEAQIQRGGVSASASQIISGWAGKTFPTTLVPVPGAGFKDNRNFLTTPFTFETENGAFIDADLNLGITLDVTVDRFTLAGLQIRNRSGGGYTVRLRGERSAVTFCIADGAGMGHNAPTIRFDQACLYPSLTNSLVLGRNKIDAMTVQCGAVSGEFICDRNTLISTVPNPGIGEGAGYGEAIMVGFIPAKITNTVAIGFMAFDFWPDSSKADPASGHNATSLKAFTCKGFASDSQVGVATAQEFMAPVEDWRLKTTSRQLKGKGISGGDIGAWQTSAVPSPGLGP